jgi:5-methylcytosine-specific restriction protein A
MRPDRDGAPGLQHRRPAIPFSDAPRGTCRWCGEPILHPEGPKHGQVNFRRRWHPACVAEYDSTDPRELRRTVRKRDRGACRACGLDTNALRRQIRGRGRTARLRELGFLPRRSLWELDHVVPLIDGGGHELSNLQTLCVPCHRKKSADETRARAKKRGVEVERERGEDEDRSLEALLARADAANARAEAQLDRS